MFDAYHKWLGIPKHQRPPTHYQLLGIGQDEADPEVIEEAALRQTAHVRTYQIGPHGAECTKLLNEISHARTVLLNPAKRKAYDATIPKRKPTVLIAPGAEEAVTGKVNPFAQLTPEDAPSPAPPPRAAVSANVTKKGPPLGLFLGIGGGAAAAILAIVLVIVFTRGGGNDDKKGPGPIVKLDDGKIKKDKDQVPPKDNLDKVLINKDGDPKKDVVVKVDPKPKKDDSKVINSIKNPPIKDLTKAKLGRQVANGGYYTSAHFAPDVRIVAAAGPDGLARAWRLPNQTEEFWKLDEKVGFKNLGKRLALSRDGDKVLLGMFNQPFCMVMYETATGKELKRFVGKDGKGNARHGVALSPDGTLALSTGDDFSVRLWEVATGKELRRLVGHDGAALQAIFSPDGIKALTSGQDGTVRMWDVEKGGMLFKFDMGEVKTDQIPCIAFSPDGTAVACACNDFTIRLLDVATQRFVRRFTSQRRIWSVAFSADCSRIAAGGDEGYLQMIDVPTRQLLAPMKIGHSPVYSVEFIDKDHSLLVACDGVKIIDLTKVDFEVKDPVVAKGDKLFPFDRVYYKSKAGPITAVALDPTGQKIAWADSSGLVLKNLASGIPYGNLGPDTLNARGIVFSANGKYMAVACNDSHVRIWDLSTLKRLPMPLKHTNPIRAIAIDNNGNYLVSASGKLVTLWDLKDGSRVKDYLFHTNDVLDVALSSDGKFIFSACRDKSICRWPKDADKPDKQYRPENPFGHVAFSPNGLQALVFNDGPGLRLWDLDKGEEVRSFPSLKTNMWSLAWSRCGSFGAVGFDGEWQIFDIASGKLQGHFQVTDGIIKGIAVTSLADFAVTASDDGTVLLWSQDKDRFLVGGAPKVDKEPVELAKAGGPMDFATFKIKPGVSRVAISPDGQRALTAGDNAGVHEWDLKTGQLLHTIVAKGKSGPQGGAVAYLPDGQRAVYSLWHRDLQLFDLKQEKVLGEFEDGGQVTSVAVNKYKQVLTGGATGVLVLWNGDTRQVVKRFPVDKNAISYLSVAFSPDGTEALAGAYTGLVQHWNMVDHRQLNGWPHKGGVLAVAFSRLGSWGVAATSDFKATGVPILSLKGAKIYPPLPVQADALAIINDYVLTADKDRRVRLWNPRENKETPIYQHPEEVVVSHFAASASGDFAVSVGPDGTLRVWPLKKMLTPK